MDVPLVGRARHDHKSRSFQIWRRIHRLSQCAERQSHLAHQERQPPARPVRGVESSRPWGCLESLETAQRCSVRGPPRARNLCHRRSGMCVCTMRHRWSIRAQTEKRPCGHRRGGA
eukprot:7386346-Prymnesium_polylepis.1